MSQQPHTHCAQHVHAVVLGGTDVSSSPLAFLEALCEFGQLGLRMSASSDIALTILFGRLASVSLAGDTPPVLRTRGLRPPVVSKQWIISEESVNTQ